MVEQMIEQTGPRHLGRSLCGRLGGHGGGGQNGGGTARHEGGGAAHSREDCARYRRRNVRHCVYVHSQLQPVRSLYSSSSTLARTLQ